MCLPGFTAEVSLGKSRYNYRGAHRRGGTAAGVLPASRACPEWNGECTCTDNTNCSCNPGCPVGCHIEYWQDTEGAWHCSCFAGITISSPSSQSGG